MVAHRAPGLKGAPLEAADPQAAPGAANAVDAARTRAYSFRSHLIETG